MHKAIFRALPTTVGFLLALAGLLCPPEAFGQPPRDPKELRKEIREQRLQGVREDTERTRETVMLFFVNELRQHLSLSKEQTLDLLPLFEEAEDIRASHGKQREQRLEALRAAVQDPNSSDKDIERLLKDLEKEEAKFRADEESVQRKINAKLTMRQRAQLVFVQAAFKQKLQRRLEDIRWQRRGFADPAGDAERLRLRQRWERQASPPPGAPPEGEE